MRSTEEVSRIRARYINKKHCYMAILDIEKLGPTTHKHGNDSDAFILRKSAEFRHVLSPGTILFFIDPKATKAGAMMKERAHL